MRSALREGTEHFTLDIKKTDEMLMVWGRRPRFLRVEGGFQEILGILLLGNGKEENRTHFFFLFGIFCYTNQETYGTEPLNVQKNPKSSTFHRFSYIEGEVRREQRKASHYGNLNFQGSTTQPLNLLSDCDRRSVFYFLAIILHVKVTSKIFCRSLKPRRLIIWRGIYLFTTSR